VLRDSSTFQDHNHRIDYLCPFKIASFRQSIPSLLFFHEDEQSRKRPTRSYENVSHEIDLMIVDFCGNVGTGAKSPSGDRITIIILSWWCIGHVGTLAVPKRQDHELETNKVDGVDGDQFGEACQILDRGSGQITSRKLCRARAIVEGVGERDDLSMELRQDVRNTAGRKALVGWRACRISGCAENGFQFHLATDPVSLPSR